MGRFGGPSPKRHEVLSSEKKYIDLLILRAGFMSREDQRLCTSRTTRAYVDSMGVKRHVGKKKELKESQCL